VVFATSNNLVASYVGKLIEFQNCGIYPLTKYLDNAEIALMTENYSLILIAMNYK